jgi:hypothetical protein
LGRTDAAKAQVIGGGPSSLSVDQTVFAPEVHDAFLVRTAPMTTLDRCPLRSVKLKLYKEIHQ